MNFSSKSGEFSVICGAGKAVFFLERLHEVPVVLALWNFKEEEIWEEHIFFNENSGKMERVGGVWVDTERAKQILMSTENVLGVCRRVKG